MDTQIYEPRRWQPEVGSIPAAEFVVENKVVPPWEPWGLRRLPAGRLACTEETLGRIQDWEFLDMNRTYDLHGGLATGNEIAWRVGQHTGQPISTVARWIVGRVIVNLVWSSQILIPRFQFTDGDMQLRPVVSGVIAELAGVYDDWEISRWFTQPSVWLRDKRPIERVGVDDEAVMQAARADRYIVRG